jgi:hypothetical protein
MRLLCIVHALTLFGALVACGGGNARTYQGAAATAGIGVLAAGVNRKITGDCWASCPPGTRCDRERGVCVELPCRGSCPEGKRCQRVGSMYECVYEGFFDLPAARTAQSTDDADDAGVNANDAAAALDAVADVRPSAVRAP